MFVSKHRRSRLTWGLLLTLVATLVLVSPAAATWSVVGVDEETGEVGVAIASCVPASQLGDLDRPLFLVALVPEVGAGVSQAQVNAAVPPRIEVLLESGLNPDQVIADVSSEEFDEQFDARQHGVATVDGSAAGFTGESNQGFAGDLQSEGVSVQGNILVSEAVVNDTLAAYDRDPELPLADRLVAALLAGSEAGGDSRCEQTAFFAHVVVAAPGDDVESPSVLMTYGSLADGDNPVRSLADAFAAGERQSVVVPDSGGSGSSLAVIGLILAVLLTIGGVVFSRRAFR